MMSSAISEPLSFLLCLSIFVFTSLVDAMPNLSDQGLSDLATTSRDSGPEDACSFAFDGGQNKCKTPPEWEYYNMTVSMDDVLSDCINPWFENWPIEWGAFWFMSMTVGANCHDTEAKNLTIWNQKGCPKNAQQIKPGTAGTSGDWDNYKFTVAMEDWVSQRDITSCVVTTQGS